MPGIGSVRRGPEIVEIKGGQHGFVLTGPYENIESGSYVVDFTIVGESGEEDRGDDIICRLDVATDNGRTILNQTNVFRSALGQGPHRVSLPFSLSEPAVVEFRVISVGNHPFSVLSERILRRATHADLLLPMLSRPIPEANDFARRNSGELRRLYEEGASFRLAERGIVATMKGVRFNIANGDDFQVAMEVFAKNEYGVEFAGDACAIDIGMNVGLTSLLFASQRNIADVFAFEPFDRPYRRAIENFTLNSTVRHKIKACQIGLSDRDETYDVYSSLDSSIATSVRGLSEGARESITVRDAGSVLGPIISGARSKNQDIVLKVDCEGSEFAIFESLERLDLFKAISVILVEWHKWWSARTTQRTLIEPLLRNGFVVLDRTTMSDLYAGQFFAVRRSGTP